MCIRDSCSTDRRREGKLLGKNRVAPVAEDSQRRLPSTGVTHCGHHIPILVLHLVDQRRVLPKELHQLRLALRVPVLQRSRQGHVDVLGGLLGTLRDVHVTRILLVPRWLGTDSLSKWRQWRLHAQVVPWEVVRHGQSSAEEDQVWIVEIVNNALQLRRCTALRLGTVQMRKVFGSRQRHYQIFLCDPTGVLNYTLTDSNFPS